MVNSFRVWLWEPSGHVLDDTEALERRGLVKSVPVHSRGIQTRRSLRFLPTYPILWFCHSMIFQNSSSAMALKVDTKSINLSSCPDQLIPAPYLVLLFSPCSSLLAEQCVLRAVSASAAETDRVCHGDTLAGRGEKSIASSHCSSVQTQLYKPALQL